MHANMQVKSAHILHSLKRGDRGVMLQAFDNFREALVRNIVIADAVVTEECISHGNDDNDQYSTSDSGRH